MSATFRKKYFQKLSLKMYVLKKSEDSLLLKQEAGDN